MKRNTRIIQISGLRGLFFAVFVVVCLGAGFIAFPALMAMQAWNYAAEYFAFPPINIWQGVMLWAIVAISCFIINQRGKYLVALNSKKGLSDEDIKRLVERVHRQQCKSQFEDMYLKSFDFKSSENTEKSEEKDKENV